MMDQKKLTKAQAAVVGATKQVDSAAKASKAAIDKLLKNDSRRAEGSLEQAAFSAHDGYITAVKNLSKALDKVMAALRASGRPGVGGS
jgi:hypothetical protein